MELLVAVLISFGVVNSQEASKLSQDDAVKLVQDNKLEKEGIWEMETDEF